MSVTHWIGYEHKASGIALSAFLTGDDLLIAEHRVSTPCLCILRDSKINSSKQNFQTTTLIPLECSYHQLECVQLKNGIIRCIIWNNFSRMNYTLCEFSDSTYEEVGNVRRFSYAPEPEIKFSTFSYHCKAMIQDDFILTQQKIARKLYFQLHYITEEKVGLFAQNEYIQAENEPRHFFHICKAGLFIVDSCTLIRFDFQLRPVQYFELHEHSTLLHASDEHALLITDSRRLYIYSFS